MQKEQINRTEHVNVNWFPVNARNEIKSKHPKWHTAAAALAHDSSIYTVSYCKGFPYSSGLELILVYRQSARRWL